MTARPPLPRARGRVRRAARLALAFAALGCSPAAPPPPGSAFVTIRGHRIVAEIADDPAKKMLGLGERDALAEGAGMLFPYAEPDYYAFWMKGMRFDLDLIWIREGRIVDLAERVPHPRGPIVDVENLQEFRPDAPADLILEVNAGTAERFGWRRGDAVTVEPPLRGPAGAAPR